jgi:glycerol-3-phosphate O-acyltransferase/dihydroxyacetone phosphate acyltransferase
MIYRRRDAFGLDDKGLGPGVVGEGEDVEGEGGEKGEGGEDGDEGAAQCIWLARVRPEDCENIIKQTVLKGKVVKPDRQLRGGFDRGRGLLSW